MPEMKTFDEAIKSIESRLEGTPVMTEGLNEKVIEQVLQRLGDDVTESKIEELLPIAADEVWCHHLLNQEHSIPADKFRALLNLSPMECKENEDGII